MSNIQRRGGRSMDPWREFFDVDFFGNRPAAQRSSLPAVNISEDEKCFMVDVVSPGFKKDDFKIKVDDDVLTISAETKNESSEGNKEYSRREYSYSSFTRSFRLPENAKDEEINAKYSEGILHITIPKSQEQQKTSKEINID
ncbi:MAG: Hsp20/alpha crystallin family protein [Bacteroidota bacterium]|nr:Hsp20/alpha crystallin family protein [Flavisolibacter sp.]MDQ3842909.1 Hsp20/alpha crystallin family protein [Bacteroidota bacterium]MBD0284943.1 Hsp20/alpha crystallin family protein [Flavisolibacter sp.]MBD0294299.1 Hsp20/alpha crystallin family protein [Flavisolibacter sp.]MBD0350275.1 Hsp20/alpha crystallin family protein [Flavisolibacter sp.]